MLVYNYNYVTLKSVCDFNELDFYEVTQAVCESDVSFGTNYDTMISRTQLEDIVLEWLDKELQWGDLNEQTLISLGS
jgi:hypothetical protein